MSGRRENPVVRTIVIMTPVEAVEVEARGMPESTPPHSGELDRLWAERDALRRELGDLRAWLTVKLKLTNETPGPQELTVLSAASDQEIIAKIEQLMNDADERHPLMAAKRPRPGTTARRLHVA